MSSISHHWKKERSYKKKKIQQWSLEVRLGAYRMSENGSHVRKDFVLEFEMCGGGKHGGG